MSSQSSNGYQDNNKSNRQSAMAMPNNGYQYINKQVNNVKLVNNNNLTLNVRNFNNRINSINISGSNEDPTSINLKSTAKGAT
jgi:hypothetical protein